MTKQVRKKTVTETIEDDGTKKTVVKEHAPKTAPTKRKRNYKRKKPQAPKTESKSEIEKKREQLLIENFVGLQHAMTNMSIRFGTLSDNISKLLSIFEEAAKGFVIGDKVDDEQMLQKIDSLLDQNKTIAKGLVLMEEKVRTRVEHSEEAQKIAEEANKFSTQEIKAPEKPHAMTVPKFEKMPPLSSGARPSNPSYSGASSPQGFNISSNQGSLSTQSTPTLPRPKPLPRI